LRKHYKIHKPEAIELIQRYNLNFIEGNIVKYVLRSPFKGDRVGDLKKALEYAIIINPLVLKLRFPLFNFEKELQDYKELTLIDKTIIGLIINGLKCENDKEILIDYLKMSIEYERMQNIENKDKNEEKEFDPDWLPPHPLCTLSDVIDIDPIRFLECMNCLDCIELEENQLSLKLFLQDIIQGDKDFISLLSIIGYGSKEFWENRYKHYWAKRK
jgi:hypothetical protein